MALNINDITFEKRGKVGWITINRPDAANVLNSATVLALEQAVDDVKKSPDLFVGVIIGAGDRFFSAGADLKELGKLDVVWNTEYCKTCHRVFSKIESMGKPFIVGINGVAMGAGLELALAGTLRVMSEKAYLALPEVGLGVIPGAGGTQRLPRLIGKSRATWYILTGERITAEVAAHTGLVHKVAPADQVQAECEKLAATLSGKSPYAMALVLQAINGGSEIDLADGLALETALMGLATASEDAKEGIQAVANKRPPNFKGR
ncbi:MAG: enoyl-CoA hydratase/isomerase family protein [Chloroflexi bacterium]|nr:enoyl-CoA hydratase/isomerase family protein [Chloroflexota bacterium]